MQLCAFVIDIDGVWFAWHIGKWAFDPLIIRINRLSVNPKALLELDLKDIFGFKLQFSARQFELAPVYIFRKRIKAFICLYITKYRRPSCYHAFLNKLTVVLFL